MSRLNQTHLENRNKNVGSRLNQMLLENRKLGSRLNQMLLENRKKNVGSRLNQKFLEDKLGSGFGSSSSLPIIFLIFAIIAVIIKLRMRIKK